MPLNLKHQTPAQFASRMRERYRGASREEAARMAYWIIRRINAGDITDTQVRNAFGLNAVDYTTFKQRLQSAHDHWAAVLSAAGE